jgi:hypothetical protein
MHVPYRLPQATAVFVFSVALSPQVNYTDWATATCRRNLVPTFVDRGVSRGQRGGSLTVVNLSFLDLCSAFIYFSPTKFGITYNLKLFPWTAGLVSITQVLNNTDAWDWLHAVGAFYIPNFGMLIPTWKYNLIYDGVVLLCWVCCRNKRYASHDCDWSTKSLQCLLIPDLCLKCVK